MKEKFVGEKTPVKQQELPKHGEMFLDESLYRLQVEEVRHEGAKRERKGVMTAINRFLKTPAGQNVGYAIFGAGLAASATIGGRLAQREFDRAHQPDIYQLEDAPPSADSFAGDRPLDEVRDELTEWIGAERLAEMIPVERNDRERVARERRREEIRRESVTPVEGFSEYGISDESITRYLEEGFPRFMTSEGNIESIRFTSEHRAVREDYHLSAGRETAGSCSIAAGADESQITIYGAMLDERGHLRVQETFHQVLTHELAHSVDWTNLEALDPVTRLRMFHQMASHVRQPETRLFFSYVEEIQNDDARTELVNQIVEYYAEFTQAVFERAPISDMDGVEWETETVSVMMDDFARDEMSDKETARLRRAVHDDVRLVREVVQAYQPDFDWRAAAAARYDIVAEMSREMQNEQLRARIAELPLESARHLLEDALERSMETSPEPTFQDVAWLAGSGETYFTNAHYRGSIDAAAYERGREMEREIDMVQRAAIAEIEAGLSGTDAPAYRYLIAILETLENFDTTADYSDDRTLLEAQIRDYASSQKMASPEHVEAARRYYEAMTGASGMDGELARRIQVLLAQEAD
jgi:predicted DNA-binding protein YlxM (UPF0122 family)